MLGALWGERWVPAAECVRILCAVGLFRALGFVVLPLLDGIGRPGLALVYTIVAAVVLPLSFVLSAVLLGDYYGYLSVAIAWAVGYPIAFGVLALLTLAALELRASEYARRVIGIFGSAGAATLVGWGMTYALDSLPRMARFATTAGATAVVFMVLLAYLQGLSPRSLYRAVKDGS
jgi:O-antigen/teichoic acid export membrane protein